MAKKKNVPFYFFELHHFFVEKDKIASLVMLAITGAITKQVCEKIHTLFQALLYNSIYCIKFNIISKNNQYFKKRLIQIL